MIYLIDKRTWKMKGIFANIKLANKSIADNAENPGNFYLLTEVNMNYVSKIVFVDDTCVYNNLTFWKSNMDDLIEKYDEHTVTDSIGNKITKERFLTELNNNLSRIASIDGDDGQVIYNMTVAREFIAIVRTEFKNTHLETYDAYQFAMDISAIESMVMDGAFREGAALLETVKPSEFMTPERIAKYQAMLTAADAMTYNKEKPT